VASLGREIGSTFLTFVAWISFQPRPTRDNIFKKLSNDN